MSIVEEAPDDHPVLPVTEDRVVASLQALVGTVADVLADERLLLRGSTRLALVDESERAVRVVGQAVALGHTVGDGADVGAVGLLDPLASVQEDDALGLVSELDAVGRAAERRDHRRDRRDGDGLVDTQLLLIRVHLLPVRVGQNVLGRVGDLGVHEERAAVTGDNIAHALGRRLLELGVDLGTAGVVEATLDCGDGDQLGLGSRDLRGRLLGLGLLGGGLVSSLLVGLRLGVGGGLVSLRLLRSGLLSLRLLGGCLLSSLLLRLRLGVGSGLGIGVGVGCRRCGARGRGAGAVVCEGDTPSREHEDSGRSDRERLHEPRRDARHHNPSSGVVVEMTRFSNACTEHALKQRALVEHNFTQ